MNRGKYTLMPALAVAVSTLQLHAQDTLHLSLQEAWQKAEEHSRAVKIRKKTVEISHEELKDLRVERLPEIGFEATAEKASNIPVYEHGLFSKPSQHEVIHTLYRAGADLYLNIYNGNRLNLKIAEEKLLHHMAEIREHETLSGIRYTAAALFLDIRRSFIFRQLIRQDIADQEQQLREVRSLHRNGTVLRSDVLRVELELSRRRMLLVRVENDILIASQQLNIIMGAPDETVIMPEVPAEQETAKTYEAHLSEALHHSFPYQLSTEALRLSTLRVRQVKANVRPKAGIYSEFYYANPQIFLFPYNPYWYSLGVAGLKVSYPISALYHNIHKVKAARLELVKEEEAHRHTADKVRQQVKEAFLRYKEALVEIDVATANVAHAEENARIVKNTYFNHTALVTDLLDADVQLLQSRFDLAAARIKASTRYYLLQNITGVL